MDTPKHNVIKGQWHRNKDKYRIALKTDYINYVGVLNTYDPCYFSTPCSDQMVLFPTWIWFSPQHPSYCTRSWDHSMDYHLQPTAAYEAGWMFRSANHSVNGMVQHTHTHHNIHHHHLPQPRSDHRMWLGRMQQEQLWQHRFITLKRQPKADDDNDTASRLPHQISITPSDPNHSHFLLRCTIYDQYLKEYTVINTKPLLSNLDYLLMVLTIFIIIILAIEQVKKQRHNT